MIRLIAKPKILEDWILSLGSSYKSLRPELWLSSNKSFNSWQAKWRLISESQDEGLDSKKDPDSKEDSVSKEVLGSNESFG